MLTYASNSWRKSRSFSRCTSRIPGATCDDTDRRVTQAANHQMSRDAGHRNWVRDLCRAHGFEPNESQYAGDMIAGIVMASNGFGVQVVPASAQAMSLPGLVFRPLGSKMRIYDSMELQCAYLRNEQSPLLRGLLKIVHDFRQESVDAISRNARVDAKTQSRKRR